MLICSRSSGPAPGQSKMGALDEPDAKPSQPLKIGRTAVTRITPG
jgi:hypothetical protein